MGPEEDAQGQPSEKEPEDGGLEDSDGDATGEDDPDEEEWTASELEELKLLYDLFKHISTLATVAVVIMGTTAANFFGDSPHLIQLFFSFGFLGISVFGSVNSMFFITSVIGNPGYYKSHDTGQIIKTFAFRAAIQIVVLPFLFGVGIYLNFLRSTTGFP